MRTSGIVLKVNPQVFGEGGGALASSVARSAQKNSRRFWRGAEATFCRRQGRRHGSLLGRRPPPVAPTALPLCHPHLKFRVQKDQGRIGGLAVPRGGLRCMGTVNLVRALASLAYDSAGRQRLALQRRASFFPPYSRRDRLPARGNVFYYPLTRRHNAYLPMRLSGALRHKSARLRDSLGVCRVRDPGYARLPTTTLVSERPTRASSDDGQISKRPPIFFQQGRDASGRFPGSLLRWYISTAADLSGKRCSDRNNQRSNVLPAEAFRGGVR
jgi:hypothetical protein